MSQADDTSMFRVCGDELLQERVDFVKGVISAMECRVVQRRRMPRVLVSPNGLTDTKRTAVQKFERWESAALLTLRQSCRCANSPLNFADTFSIIVSSSLVGGDNTSWSSYGSADAVKHSAERASSGRGSRIVVDDSWWATNPTYTGTRPLYVRGPSILGRTSDTPASRSARPLSIPSKSPIALAIMGL